MRVAEWRKPARDFPPPEQYPAYVHWNQGDWGTTWDTSSSGYSSTSSGDTSTTPQGQTTPPANPPPAR
jgi:hypothetical protein